MAGGYYAFLETQTLTIGDGETLRLRNRVLPPLFDAGGVQTLRDLRTGSDVLSAVQPTSLDDTPGQDNAFYRSPVNLTLGGALELKVARGGQIIGEAGAALRVPKLINEGTIRIRGGSITIDQVLPQSFALPLGVKNIVDVLGANAQGQYLTTGVSQIPGSTNAIAIRNTYLLGELAADVGVDLREGSVTDLSGVSLRDPFAQALIGATVQPLRTGRILSGGSLSIRAAGVSPFPLTPASEKSGSVPGQKIVIGNGALLDLTGATDVYDARSTLSATGYVPSPVYSAGGLLSAPDGFAFAPGAIIRASGGDPRAGGGTLELGGSNVVEKLLTGGVLPTDFGATRVNALAVTQEGSEDANDNVVSVALISRAGFDSVTVRGDLEVGDGVDLRLSGVFSVSPKANLPKSFPGVISEAIRRSIDLRSSTYSTIGGTGSARIDAAIIQLVGFVDRVVSPKTAAGTGSLTLSADQIDIVRAIYFGGSLDSISLLSRGDIRLTGASPLTGAGGIVDRSVGGATLNGEILAVGDLNLIAQRIFPTTGSTFSLFSTNGTINFGRTGNVTAVPYSAGATLNVQAANITQGGAIFVPQGTLNLGSLSPIAAITAGSAPLRPAIPATASLDLLPGSLTSVSGGSITIPYGTTTDQKEYFFSPTIPDALKAPPSKLLALRGGQLTVQPGAIVDVSGGGDVFAYEFVPGTTGSRDVLSRTSDDRFTTTRDAKSTATNPVYLQYPDGRQVYAIVPGLSDAALAAYDPIYSRDYAALYAGGDAGKRVFLDNPGGGLVSGWYTLLPAQYAVLPGGVRIVERSGAASILGQPAGRLADGTDVVTGRFGGPGRTVESRQRLFDVQSQGVFKKYSRIELTGASKTFADIAARNKIDAPRLGADAGQISLAANGALSLRGSFLTNAAPGGRGAIADVAGRAIYIGSADRGQAFAGEILADGSEVRLIGGALVLCEAGSLCLDGTNGRLSDAAPTFVSAGGLDALNAESLLIGGTRTFNGDGTVGINTTAQRIVVANDAANPLYAPDILFAVGFGQNALVSASVVAISNDVRIGQARSLAVLTGSVLEARGTVLDRSVADYIAQGGYGFPGVRDNQGVIINSRRITAGAFLRVSNGPERFIRRDGLSGDADIATLPAAQRANGALLSDRYSASLDIGAGARLSGASILTDVGTYANPTLAATGFAPTQRLSISSDAKLEARNLGISAGSVLFGDTAPDGFRGVLVTNDLVKGFSAASRLTIASNDTIGIGTGTRAFGDLRLFAPGLAATDGDVTLTAARLELGNRNKNSSVCLDGAEVCGTGSLSIATGELILGAGVIDTSRFGGGTTITASGGIFARGVGGLNAGAAALTLNAPIIADRAFDGVDQPRVAFTTTGALRVISATGPAAAPAAGLGYPGSTVTLDGGSILVSGSRIRTTSGATQLIARTGDLTVENGAIIEAPGYDQVFGTVDPVTRAAPGGRVRLQADAGSLFVDASSTLSVGGGAGIAGTLELISPSSADIDGIQGRLDGRARLGTASLTLDFGGAFDFAGFASRAAQTGFGGALDIRTRTGTLALNAGQSLSAQSVKLTADGGLADIAGTIDTTGTNGGDIGLYGRDGVALRSSAQLVARARGYSPDSRGNAIGRVGDDARVATGGNVTLGTGATGALTVADGALIDTSPLRAIDLNPDGSTGAGGRLIPLLRNGNVFYNYAQADKGGTVTFRAPVNDATASLVNIRVGSAASIRGAREVAIEGYRSYDLAAIAATGDASAGVTFADDGTTVLLDPRGSFLSGAGGIVPFIRNFDISASDGNLGGLDRLAGFRARPGVDIQASGGLTLTRNWNLAAGTVDIERARAAGLADSFTDPRTGKSYDYVPVGDGTIADKNRIQSALFSDFTDFLYRVGGKAGGEAPVIALKAGGTLTLNGSINDGFFSFRDQTGDYLAAAQARQPLQYVPYSANANSSSPDAAGNIAEGAGDPFGSMELLPLLSSGRAAVSSSYRLTGGSDLASAQPGLTAAGRAGDVVSRGSYTYKFPYLIRDRQNLILVNIADAPVTPVIRTGSGRIEITASGALDLKGSDAAILLNPDGMLASAANIATSKYGQIGGTQVYTAGIQAAISPFTVGGVSFDTSPYIPEGSNLTASRLSEIFSSTSAGVTGIGVLAADPVFAENGGAVSAFAGGDIFSQTDLAFYPQTAAAIAGIKGPNYQQPWRVGQSGKINVVRINAQQFKGGIGSLGGGNIAVGAGGSISQLSVTADSSLLTADGVASSGPNTGLITRSLSAYGGGDVRVAAFDDILGGNISVASGMVSLSAGRDIGSAGPSLYRVLDGAFSPRVVATDLGTRLSFYDARVEVNALRALSLQSVSGLGLGTLSGRGSVGGSDRQTATAFYSDKARLDILANSGIAIVNDQTSTESRNIVAPYPGSLTAIAFRGGLSLAPAARNIDVVLIPQVNGVLELLAARDLTGTQVSQDDGDLSRVPGLFSDFTATLDAFSGFVVQAGRSLQFPNYGPTVTDIEKRLQHAQRPNHIDDLEPVRIYAGGDILNAIVSSPKKAVVESGRDIVNLGLSVQNLSAGDISVVKAAQDITSTAVNLRKEGAPLSAPFVLSILGNVFQIGGPGNFILEAGRDAGPFVNSAVATVSSLNSAGSLTTKTSTYAGGIQSVGNDQNPYLSPNGASITVRFGTAGGIAFDAFRDAYLNPANLPQLPDQLFQSTASTAAGILGEARVYDRTKPIYAPKLLAYVKANAAGEAQAKFGTTSDLTYEQAYAVFASLPKLRQQPFLQEVYFQELIATSDLGGASYLKYSRGYSAINTLFPPNLGYTQNDLTGRANGSASPVKTGDLDLRLAAIETNRGGDIRILGPGGRVIAGSAVSTDQQASRRGYLGNYLLQGQDPLASIRVDPKTNPITSIPSGFEGILTQRGDRYTPSPMATSF